MSPPINLDGDTVDAITIGGDSVSEVTVDGSTVFSAIPDSGISRWTFDDADTSGSTLTDIWGDNDATNNGATTSAPGANRTYTTNEAYSLDGSDDYLNAPYTDPDNASVACWVNLDSTSSNGIFGGVWSGTASERAIKLWHASDSGSTTGLLLDVSASGGAEQVEGDVLPTDEWHHVAGTYDGSEAVLYLDGSQVATTSLSGTLSSSPLDFTIGAQDSNAPTAFYGGDLDDMRLYDKGLSATEVSNLYNTGSIDG